jgi:hypothetical protein
MNLPTTFLPMASVHLPTGELDENRAINIIGGWLVKLPHEIWLDKEFNREWLQITLEEGLREGAYELCALATKGLSRAMKLPTLH